MSIPPLVCSTPPPPEQVECDDRIHDDFGLPYDLTPEEEYGIDTDFQAELPTSFYIGNDLTGSISDFDSPHPISLEQSDIHIYTESSKSYGAYTTTEERIREDNIIEDLDLKCDLHSKQDLKININVEAGCQSNNVLPDADANSLLVESSIVRVETNTRKDEETANFRSEINCVPDILDLEENIIQDLNSQSIADTDNFKISTEKHLDDIVKDLEISSDGLDLRQEDDFSDFNFVTAEINLEKEVLSDLGFQNNTSLPVKTVIDISDDINDDINQTDDDFDDFDTFQFSKTGSETLTEAVEDVLGGSDPWSSNTNVANDFGDFQAKFNDATSDETKNEQIIVSDIKDIPKNANIVNDEQEDDDFGDFDDFQSSQSFVQSPLQSHLTENESAWSNSAPFNFLSIESETQLLENLERTVHSVFEEAMPENESNIESNIESKLSVTWRHLTETEVRQPYVLNWNNSTSQKALLKSLSIDSRNILFGPKWSHTPRYAANLGSSPLQPLKKTPVATTNSDGTSTNSDGEKHKQIDTWTDSTMNDSQESCNDSNQNKIETGTEPIHGVFQEGILKPSKTFSAALPLQPLRQINLPDTHIFTPTDSEIPRSKTIHYDNMNSLCNLSSVKPNTENIKTLEDEENNDDFDDFQDFQNSVNTLPHTNSPKVMVSSTKISNESTHTKDSKELTTLYNYQIQSVLEPIKLEPTIPKLNWPEPGEVKETFEDFSNFVSNSTCSNIDSTIKTSQTTNITSDLDKVLSASEIKQSGEIKSNELRVSDIVEDEFDKFQFASESTDFSNFAITAVEKHNSDIIMPGSVNILPVNGILHPMKPLQMQSTSIPANKTPHIATSSQFQILQPISIDKPNNSPEKMTSQQILQPLSLESISQINWPNPGMDLQDLSRFNPINAVHSLHNSPVRPSSSAQNVKSQPPDDDGWGDFISIKPSKSSQLPPKPAEDDDWSDFVSNVTPKPPNGVNTISFNVHTSSSNKFSPQSQRSSEGPLAIPALNYITPKTNQSVVKDSQFQNL